MESILVEIRNPDEKRVLTAFLKSLKINFESVSPAMEDKAMLNAIKSGKKDGRATKKEQQDFENRLKSL